jgi:rod shape determining protein RodA
MYLKRLDWFLNLGILALFGAGFLSLASANRELFWLQLLWGAMGFSLIIFLANFDFRSFVNYRWFIFGIYGVSIFLLVLTYFLAPTIRGAKAWLPLGPFQFQTSEFAKLALILVYSYFFAKRHIGIAHFNKLFLSFLYFLIPAGLVILQPDMGSALILFGIWFGYLLVSGLPWKHIFLSGIVFITALVLMWFFVLKDYQKERIIGLFVPERDPLGINYSVIQSKIAIGSAGFLGKGFGQGTQVQLGFLPEAQTDFIFAAFIEEWGMLGGAIVLGLFTLILFRIMKIGLGADNNFGKLICLGSAILFLLHFLINVGSNLALIPVIGVPFPFLSYGGSNFLISSLLAGMIQSIRTHRRF